MDCYRAVHNPIINTTAEKHAVTQALVTAGLDFEVHIVSMSIGQLPGASSPSIGLALDFAYSRGKMLVCAAGSWAAFLEPPSIIFPANHPTTIAITGIKVPDNYPDELLQSAENCSGCMYGTGVDFAVIMERADNPQSTTLAVTCDGDVPSYSNRSSCATATFAGMAALVWSHSGTDATREQVLTKLQESSSNPNGDNLWYGYGWVDVQKALEE